MSYSNKLRIEIPNSLYEIACNIARALDPDVGGEYSFGPRLQEDNKVEQSTYSTETLCTSDFASQVITMLQHPDILHSVVSADYSVRWQQYQSPTLQDCIDFCKSATVTDVSNTESK